MSDNFTISSCILDDVWHPKKKREAYEWWNFDALSDDGREAVTITFLDNFIFSPQYNSEIRNLKNEIHSTNGHSATFRFPAVVFVYYRDGKAIYRAISEYGAEDFRPSSDNPECHIGKSSFRFESAAYGDGYVITVDTTLGKHKRVQANFEWLSIESNFLPNTPTEKVKGHSWNLVAPRSDVTGRIKIVDNAGISSDEINFRGTGYHDHDSDDRWLPETVKSWQRGRVHFPDATAVFFRYCETESESPITKLCLIRDGKIEVFDATSDAQQFSRNIFRVKYPSRFQIASGKNLRLKIKQNTISESSFFYIRFFSEMTLSLGDGKPRKGIGISEHLAPKALKYRWLDWLTALRLE